MKKFLIRFILTGSIVLALLVTYYEKRFDLQDISDALFVVGTFTFFISLISITDASKIFYGMGYTFGNMFGRGNRKKVSFYDYAQAKNKKRDNPLGISMLLVGVLYISVSVYIGFYILG